LNRLSRAHERYRQTTDGRATTYSERERDTFAKNEVALQRAEIRMVRWMCTVKVKDRVPSKEFKERLGIGDYNLGTTAKQAAMV